MGWISSTPLSIGPSKSEPTCVRVWVGRRDSEIIVTIATNALKVNKRRDLDAITLELGVLTCVHSFSYTFCTFPMPSNDWWEYTWKNNVSWTILNWQINKEKQAAPLSIYTDYKSTGLVLWAKYREECLEITCLSGHNPGNTTNINKRMPSTT